MKPIHAASVIAAAAIVGGWILTAPASSAPPTVTPSPGYDARLQLVYEFAMLIANPHTVSKGSAAGVKAVGR